MAAIADFRLGTSKKRTALSLEGYDSIALCLPAEEPETTGGDEALFHSDERNELHRSLMEKIGPLDAYWEIYDSTQKQEPVQGSLAGDISEIYFDLKQSRKAFNLTCYLIGA